LRRLEKEHNNLRVALGYSRESSGEVETGLRLAGTLSRFWRLHGYLSEGRGWLEAMLAKPGDETTAARARGLYGAGFLAYHQGDYDSAVPRLERSLEVFRELSDAEGEGDALQLLALTAWRHGEYDRAIQLHEESLEVYRPIGDKRKLAVVLNNLGLVVRRQGDYTRARALYEESLALKREVGDEAAAAITLHNLGEIASEDESDYLRAVALERESLEISRRLGEKRSITMALITLGNIGLKQADYSRAQADYKESLVLAQELGDRPRIAECLEGLATLAGEKHDPHRAAILLGAADKLREAIGATRAPARQGDYARTFDATSAALGDDPFDAALARGRAVSLEDVIAYAMEDPAAVAALPQER
jgi:non-specific serine/threonine protein kinase